MFCGVTALLVVHAMNKYVVWLLFTSQEHCDLLLLLSFWKWEIYTLLNWLSITTVVSNFGSPHIYFEWMFLNVRVLHIWLHMKLSPKGRQKKSVQRKKDMRRNEWDLLLRTLRCAAQWVSVSNFVHKLVN